MNCGTDNCEMERTSQYLIATKFKCDHWFLRFDKKKYRFLYVFIHMTKQQTLTIYHGLFSLGRLFFFSLLYVFIQNANKFY